MKKFAKYLPVKGEIKKGDYFYDGSENGVFQAQIDMEQKGGCKKVKLFLCSRDISIGDKVRRPSGFSERPDLEFTVNSIGERDGKKLYKEGDENYHTKGTEENTYKVIGEISPDAIWVTEGMEFEDDEINIENFIRIIKIPVFFPYKNLPDRYRFHKGLERTTLVHFNMSDFESYEVDDESILRDDLIKIKCPTCKQFH